MEVSLIQASDTSSFQNTTLGFGESDFLVCFNRFFSPLPKFKLTYYPIIYLVGAAYMINNKNNFDGKAAADWSMSNDDFKLLKYMFLVYVLALSLFNYV